MLGALIIPDDLASNLQSALKPGTVEVFYNAEDPAKQQYVENTSRRRCSGQRRLDQAVPRRPCSCST